MHAYTINIASSAPPPPTLQASVILNPDASDADDQTCSTIDAEGQSDVSQSAPICTFFSQTMFANMDKLPDFISSGDNKCDAPSPSPPPRCPASLPRRRPTLAASQPRSLAASQPRGLLHLSVTTRHARVMPAARTPPRMPSRARRAHPPAASFTFNNYAPLLIVILCGCTYLNLFSNLASCCMRCVPCINAQSNSFSFDEDFSDTRIDHGAQILTRERQAMAEGSPLGANLQLLSGATSDGEEASRSARQAPSSASRNLNRWNHLQDEHL